MDLEAGRARHGVQVNLNPQGLYDTARLLRAAAVGASAAWYGGKRAYEWVQGEAPASKRQKGNGNNSLLLARIMSEKRKAYKYNRQGSRKTYVGTTAELAAALKKSMGPAHYIDHTVSLLLTTAGTVTLATLTAPGYATGITQGAGNTQRVGKKIKYKYVQVRGEVVGGTQYTNARKICLVLIYDRRPTGTIPTIGEIFDSSAGLVAVPNQPNLDAHSNRFKILLRRDYVFDGNRLAGDAQTEMVKDVNETVKLGLPCVFGSAGTGAMGDIEQGAIYTVWANSQATAGAPDIFVGNVRVRFWDVL